ncbi:MAG: hypothetical protein VKJ06_08280 [Vampirovibrionales bacterium]|nr:hypothetical protein [Vampirovibrionales bacterium]
MFLQHDDARNLQAGLRWLVTEDVFSGQPGKSDFLLIKSGIQISPEQLDKLRAFGVQPKLQLIPPTPAAHSNPILQVNGALADATSNINHSRAYPTALNHSRAYPHVVLINSDLKAMRRATYWLLKSGLSLSRLHPVAQSAQLPVLMKKYAPQGLVLCARQLQALRANMPELFSANAGVSIALLVPEAAAQTEAQQQGWQEVARHLHIQSVWFQPLGRKQPEAWLAQLERSAVACNL